MFDGPLMLWVNNTIHPQSNTFAMGVKIKATGEKNLKTALVRTQENKRNTCAERNKSEDFTAVVGS